MSHVAPSIQPPRPTARVAPEHIYEDDGAGHRELRWLTDGEITTLLRDAWQLYLEAGGPPLSKPDLDRHRRRKG